METTAGNSTKWKMDIFDEKELESNSVLIFSISRRPHNDESEFMTYFSLFDWLSLNSLKV